MTLDYKRIQTIIICLVLFIGLVTNTTAQNKTIVKIYTLKNDNCYSIKVKKLKNSNQTNEYCHKLINKSVKKGFIASSIDSVFFKNDTTNIIFNLGNKYYLKQLNTFNEDKSLLLKYSTIPKRDKKYTLRTLKNEQKVILTELQNQGYPFPTIKNETKIDSNYFITHNLTPIKGNVFTYKTLNIDSLPNSELKYLTNVTKIKKGAIYKKKDIENLNKSINNTGIFTTDSINLEYLNNQVEITPFLNRTKGNTASALVGIQTNKNEKTTITGNAELHTKSLLNFGEQIDFKWKKNNEYSQFLIVKSKIPYLFNSPIGILAELAIDKQDSTFTKQALKFGFAIPISHKFEISTYYSNVNSTMAKNINSKQFLYGITFNYNKTDNFYFPQKGFTTLVDINGGNRKQNTSESSLIFQNQTDINLYFKLPVGNIQFRNLFGYIFNDSIKQSEFFQLGGTKTMRGFNENSIFSKLYNISSIEYRIVISNNSYTTIFYDSGLFDDYSSDKPYTIRQAIGAGITLNTKAGTLTILYALGKLNHESVNIGNAKIHIGYTATF